MASILIADDETIIAAELEERLTALGYTVAGTVRTGADAVTRALATRPDIILMDIVMPGELDGIEAAARIGAVYDVPIIFLTAHADEKKLARAGDVCAYNYLLKPFQAAQLQSAIELALYKHRTDRALKASLRKLRATVQERDSLVEHKTEQLHDVNTALQVLLRQVGNGNSDALEPVLKNLECLIQPNIAKIKNSRNLKAIQETINIVEKDLATITSNFVSKVSNCRNSLTSAQLQVANLVKQGKSNKEIADLLNVSPRTVETHRLNIRKKLDISNKNTNLRSYLMSLD